jgi:Ca2+-binding RTX toxin-like protein
MSRKIVVGTNNNDRLLLGDENYDISALNGNNSILVGDGDNRIAAGDGNNQVAIGDVDNEVELGGGKNRVTAGDGANSVSTGEGHDTIVLGDGENFIRAGAGNNRITLGSGDNIVEAGEGNDKIQVGEGFNVIRAGGGRNNITATGDTDIHTGDQDDKIQLGEGHHLVSAGGGKNTIQTGDATVDIKTGDGDDKISVGDGTGTISAGNGKNKISTGEGSFRISTGTGSDQIRVGDGDATISAGDGNDSIYTGDGSFTITAEAGRNQVQTGDGQFNITLGSGSDKVQTGRGEGQIHAGDGDNRVSAGDGSYVVQTGSGKDQITLGDGDYHVTSSGGNNRIKGGDGFNSITTGGGADDIRLGEGDAVIDAGDGNNKISVQDGFADITAGDGNDAISVGDGSSIIAAGAGKNRITAGDGDLTLTALDGDDAIRMGDGRSEISAGDGNNQVTVGDGQHQITAGDGKNDIGSGDGSVSVTVGDGNNQIKSGEGETRITAGDGNNKISLGEGVGYVEAGHGNNNITARDGEYSIRTGNGNNNIRLNESGGLNNSVTTGSGDDKISVGDGENEIDSGGGNDSIRTGDGNVQVQAGAGNDTVRTGAGEDWVIGGAGDDQLDGGAGSDWAVFHGWVRDYRIEALSRSTIQVTSASGEVTDIGTDQLRNFEYLYFEGDGFTLDLSDLSVLDKLYAVDLQDDSVSVGTEGPLEISLADLLENDASLGTGEAYFNIAGTSAAGLSIQFDGTTITYNDADALQHLAEGEVFTDKFTYEVVDEEGNHDTATVTVSVTGENDGPEAQDDRLDGGPTGHDAYEGGNEFSLLGNGHNYMASGGQTVALKGGGFAAAWKTANDGDGYGVSVRVFDRNGNEVKSQFLANTVTEHGQALVSLVELDGGGFAVTWSTVVDGPDGLEQQSRMRIFNEDGSSRTGEIELPDTEADLGLSLQHSVGLSNGNILVTMAGETDDFGSYGLSGAIYSPQGRLLEGPFLLADNVSWANTSSRTGIAADDTGGFVVTWNVRENTSSHSKTTLYASVFDENGVVTVSEMEVGSHTTKPGGNVTMNTPFVAINDDGTFVVTWSEGSEGIGTEASVRARVFRADGQELSDEFKVDGQISSYDPNRISNGDVTWLGGDQFVVTWSNTDASRVGVYAQIFNTDGTEASGRFLVNQQEHFGQHGSQVTLLSDGRFIVSWFSNADSDFNIQARIFEGTGEEVELPFTSEDSAAVIETSDLLWNDEDPDGDEFLFTLDSAVSESGASLSYDSDTGLITYDPTAAADIQALKQGDILEDTFTYTISDGSGGFDQATVTVLVGGLDEVLG